MQDIDRKKRLVSSRSAMPETANDDELDYRSWLARLTKFLVYSRIGYPYYSPAYVQEHIDKPTTSREELHQYKTTAEPTRLTTAKRYVYFVLSLAFLIKSLGLPLLIFSEFDLKNPESNIIMLTNHTYRFGCLVSNCTKLGQSAREHDTNAAAETNKNVTINLKQLSETLFELPYLSLCHPMLANLYDPTQHLGPIDSMLAALVGVMLTLGSPFSLLRDLYKADNMMLMFLVAPRVTRQVVKDRAKRLLRALKLSRYNFMLLSNKLNDIYREQKVNQYLQSGFGEVMRMPTGSKRGPRRVPSGIRTSLVDAFPGLSPIEYKGYFSQSCHAIPEVTKSERKALERLEILREIEEEELQKLTPLDGASELSAEDCVSVMRSAWWRARVLDRILYMTVSLINFCVLAYVFSLYLVLDSVPKDQVKLNEIGSRAENCSFWLINRPQLDDHPLQSFQDVPIRDRYLFDSIEQFKLGGQVHFDRLQLESSTIRTILYVTQYLLTFVGYSTFLTVFFMTVGEITGWLCEVKFELMLGTKFVEQLISSSSGQVGASTAPNHEDYSGTRSHMSTTASRCRMAHKRPYQYQHFKMDATIRSKFKPLAGFSFIVNDCKLLGKDCLPTSSYLESVQAIEEYATERIVTDRLCLCSAVDLLEKLYTSFRIHVEHVRCYDRTMTIMIVCANIYNYFVIFADLIYIRSIKGHLLFPLWVLLFSWSFINTVIVIASNFHAKAKKLHSLIWTLLAVTSECSDIRIMHMRHLWLKQVLALDSDGGLSLRALGLRITYTNIIQLVVISGTIVVFMLR